MMAGIDPVTNAMIAEGALKGARTRGKKRGSLAL